jgi:hypothetical protein
MPSTYSSGLGLEKIANGEQASSWGTTTNENLDFIDDALYGNVTVTLSSTSHTLDMQDGTTCSARNAYISFAGSPGGNVAVSLTPNSYQRVFTVKNNTAYTLTFSQGSGASLAVPTGAAALVVADGAGAGAAVIGGMISPLLELAVFKTSSAPGMDGVGRVYRTTDGMCYDGYSHYFYVGNGPSRVMGAVLFNGGDVKIAGSHLTSSSIAVNAYGTGDRLSDVSLYGDDSGAPGFRALRFDTGANAPTSLQHWGTGNLYLEAVTSGGSVGVRTGDAERVRITSAGDFGIGTISPAQKLDVVGAVKATSFKIGNNTITYAAAIPTSSGTKGDIAFNTGVTAGGTLGWVCTGGTTWKIFGIVAA